MAISETEKAGSSVKNSTNGHAILLPIPNFVRFPFRLASSVSPRLGGEVGRQIFFRPPRPRYLASQRAILGRARELRVNVTGERIAAYEWGEGPAAVLLVHGWGGHAG